MRKASNSGGDFAEAGAVQRFRGKLFQLVFSVEQAGKVLAGTRRQSSGQNPLFLLECLLD